MSAGAWKADNPWPAKYGFGPSVKAERWNGRHAMFGWFMIIMTGYAKTHGWFPDADTALQYKDWGSLVALGDNKGISNERAIIMVAHIHALAVSIAAAFGPQILGDSLTLLDGEEDEEPYGFFIPLGIAAPPFKPSQGLTPAAEMVNGRLAMLGLIVLVLTSVWTGMDPLDVIDVGTGGVFLGGLPGGAAAAPVVEAVAEAADAVAAAAPSAAGRGERARGVART